MSTPTDRRDIETRLIAALTDTARRNLSDATPAPAFRPDSPASQPDGRIRNWALPALAAAVVVAVAIALILPNRRHYSSMPPAKGPGTLITLRAHGEGLGAADLRKAQQVISARAVALGAANPDVRIVGPDEIAAFLPGVPASKVGALGTIDAYQIRPFIINWTLAPKWPMSVPSIPDPPVIDQWKSLGFAPPEDAAAFRALSQARQNAVRAVITHWNCSNRPLDRADEPIVICDPLANKYLLGPTILSSKDVGSVEMSTSAGTIRQYLRVNLSAAGRQRWTDHLAQIANLNPLDVGNEFANLLDDVVVQVSSSKDPSGVTYVGSPSTTQKVDVTMVANLTAGPLPALFDLVSVRGN